MMPGQQQQYLTIPFCSDHQMTLRFTQLGQYSFYKYPIFQDRVFICIRDNPSEESIQLSIPSLPCHPTPPPSCPLLWVAKKVSEISLLALTF